MTWEEINENPVIRTEIDVPFHPFKNVLDRGDSPFLTPTGKIEFESTFVKNNDLTKTRFRGQFEAMPVWKPSYLDADISVASNDGFYNPKVKKYPLSMVSPCPSTASIPPTTTTPSCARTATATRCGSQAWTRRRAASKDGDICRVYSDRGEVQLTAYVTNRMTPGTAAVHHGAWFQTDGSQVEMNKFGADLRGTPNILLDDGHLPHLLGALITSGLVEVEKIADGDAEGFGHEAERGGMRARAWSWACVVRWAKRSVKMTQYGFSSI